MRQREVRAVVTGPEQESDAFHQESAGYEREYLSRRRIKPLRIIDDTQQRLFFGNVGKQIERGESDQETIRRGAFTETECGPESIALRPGQEPTTIQHG